MPNTPIVSVILATKNEEKNIENCLRSIQKQSYPQKNIEIIVVDNNSADNTRKIAKLFTSKVYNLPEKINFNRIQNFRGAQVNYGVKKSRGEIIFFPDADMTFDKTLIDEAVKKIIINKIDALYVPETIVGNGLFGKVRQFERSFYNQTPIDAVRIVRKTIYQNVGGFDESKIKFGPDDWDLTKSIKTITNKITITKNKIYHHEELLNFMSYIFKKQKYTTTFDGYIKKWGENDNDIKKQFGIYYRYIGVFIEDGKWRKIVNDPFIAMVMLGVRLLVGFLYIFRKITTK